MRAEPFVSSEPFVPPSRRPPRVIRRVDVLVCALGGPSKFAGEMRVSRRQVHRWLAAGRIPSARESDAVVQAELAGFVWRPC